ncbi:hypothetical protein V1520DRAFT_344530 [Lipomyces starkeyi]|uniref:Uncharacterized protein n=1 Tax=Lipomyces starkeyi NRRL Y-11557 TaxID=675824 RepID=A0A1E3PUM0_LIPST|nr:hypothetical protein LIPSTDRAFT_108104 [Lipomyces starkeyi NRRL Y-11557]
MSANFESILEMSLKRISTLQLIKETCENEVYFLNVMLLTNKDVRAIFDKRRYAKRAANFYILGLSLSNLLEWSDGPEYMKAFDALLHEYEIYVESLDHRQSKGLLFWPSKSRNQSEVEHVYLKTPFIPFELDYSEVVIILCETLVQVYNKIIALVVEQDQHFPLPSAADEIFLKVDGLVRKIVVTPLMTAFESYCRTQTRSELEDLEAICASGT